MKHPISAPKVGESIAEVAILKWAKQNGESVKTGDLLMEIESDKATVEIVAEASGALEIVKNAGERIPVGEIVGYIDDSASGTVSASHPSATPTETPATPLSPAVKKMVTETGVNPAQIEGTGKGGRVTKGDVLQHLARPAAPVSAPPAPATQPPLPKVDRPGERRVPMSMLRQRIAARLLEAQHNAAILTTFNEVDMSPVMEIRNQQKEAFKSKHGVALSFMSFFTRAAVHALKAIPEVNATIDGTDILYHDTCDIGIAVGSDRGLVVPIVRGADQMSFVEIERTIGELADKARKGKLSIADMTGGTFTISNGGVYGSLFSTPILNPPQSAILGMHKIQERPMAINGKLEIRPMMYLALSYDHRLIDGKGAVTFLVTLKDYLENPTKLGLEWIHDSTTH